MNCIHTVTLYTEKECITGLGRLHTKGRKFEYKIIKRIRLSYNNWSWFVLQKLWQRW